MQPSWFSCKEFCSRFAGEKKRLALMSKWKSLLLSQKAIVYCLLLGSATVLLSQYNVLQIQPYQRVSRFPSCWCGFLVSLIFSAFPQIFPKFLQGRGSLLFLPTQQQSARCYRTRFQITKCILLIVLVLITNKLVPILWKISQSGFNGF